MAEVAPAATLQMSAIAATSATGIKWEILSIPFPIHNPIPEANNNCDKANKKINKTNTNNTIKHLIYF